MKFEFTNEEVQSIIDGLIMHRNFIETGNPILNSNDLKNMRREIRPLSIEQMKSIIRLSELTEKFRNAIQENSFE